MTATSTNPPLATLLAILDELESLARECVALSQRERVALVGRDVTPLAGVVQEKDALAARFAGAERRRLAWVAERLGTGRPEAVTLSQLLEVLPVEEARVLAARRGVFSREILAAADANRRNSVLASNLLATVRGLLRQIFGDDGARYAPSGPTEARQRSSLTLDLRA